MTSNQKKTSTRLEDTTSGKIVLCGLWGMALIGVLILAMIGTRLFDNEAYNLLWLGVAIVAPVGFIPLWISRTKKSGYRPPTLKEVGECWWAWPGLLFAVPTVIISLDGSKATALDIWAASGLIILSTIFPSIRPRRVLDESKPATADTEAAKKPTDTETEKQPTGADPKN